MTKEFVENPTSSRLYTASDKMERCLEMFSAPHAYPDVPETDRCAFASEMVLLYGALWAYVASPAAACRARDILVASLPAWANRLIDTAASAQLPAAALSCAHDFVASRLLIGAAIVECLELEGADEASGVLINALRLLVLAAAPQRKVPPKICTALQGGRSLWLRNPAPASGDPGRVTLQNVILRTLGAEESLCERLLRGPVSVTVAE
jgi:hypothetical protein